MKGSGLFRIQVRRETGEVTGVEIVKSTGHDTLDQEAIKAFSRWRLRPRTDCDGFIIPVTLHIESSSQETSNQSMKPTAPLRKNFNVFATTPSRGLSISR